MNICRIFFVNSVNFHYLSDKGIFLKKCKIPCGNGSLKQLKLGLSPCSNPVDSQAYAALHAGSHVVRPVIARAGLFPGSRDASPSQAPGSLPSRGQGRRAEPAGAVLHHGRCCLTVTEGEIIVSPADAHLHQFAPTSLELSISLALKTFFFHY